MLRLILALCLLSIPAFARDNGQWDNYDPKIRDWYSKLMQPDNPGMSCCGAADAYWCEDIHVKTDSISGKKRTFCTITDDRPDAPLGRMHVAVGTEIEIPDEKLTWKDGNPTGHSVVFLSRGYYVYCFVQNGGV